MVIQRAIVSRAVLAAILASALGAAGCTRADRQAQNNELPSPPRTLAEPAESPEKATEKPMEIDTSPAAWEAARALAAEHTGRSPDELVKKSDELPFMFSGRRMHPVLVLDGRVVTETGPQVAADYLRRLGIAGGKQPSLNSVLYVLFALRAFPTVDQLPKLYWICPDITSTSAGASPL